MSQDHGSFVPCIGTPSCFISKEMDHGSFVPCIGTPSCFICKEINQHNTMAWKLKLATNDHVAVIKSNVLIPSLKRICEAAPKGLLPSEWIEGVLPERQPTFNGVDKPLCLFHNVCRNLRNERICFATIAFEMDLVVEMLDYQRLITPETRAVLLLQTAAAKGLDTMQNMVVNFIRSYTGSNHIYKQVHLDTFELKTRGAFYKAIDTIDGVRGLMQTYLTTASIRTRAVMSKWIERAGALDTVRGHLIQNGQQGRSLALCMGLHKRLGGGAAISVLSEELVKAIFHKTLHADIVRITAGMFVE